MNQRGLFLFTVILLAYSSMPATASVEKNSRSLESFSYSENGSRMDLPEARYLKSLNQKVTEGQNIEYLSAWCDDGDSVITGGCSADIQVRQIIRTTPAIQFELIQEGPNKGRWRLDEKGNPMYKSEGWSCGFSGATTTGEGFVNGYVICQKAAH